MSSVSDDILWKIRFFVDFLKILHVSNKLRHCTTFIWRKRLETSPSISRMPKNRTFSVLMLEKIYLHQNGVELNFPFIGMASEPAISFRINPRIREDSNGEFLTDAWQCYALSTGKCSKCRLHTLAWTSQSLLAWMPTEFACMDAHFQTWINFPNKFRSSCHFFVVFGPVKSHSPVCISGNGDHLARAWAPLDTGG